MKLEEIVNEFISYDNERTKLRTPWIKDDKVYATNGHIMISFPSNLIDGFNVEIGDDTRVDASQCMEKEGFENIKPLVLIEALKSETPSYEIEPEFEDCRDCFGEGDYETDDECYSCNSVGTKTVRCDECSGSGRSTIPNLKKGKKRYARVGIKINLPKSEVLANWAYVKVISDVIEYFGGSWKVANKDSESSIHFKQKKQGVDIVLMPMRY